MLVTFFVMLVIFSIYEIGTNILNRSPTSETCHQHILSPTSVTSIECLHCRLYSLMIRPPDLRNIHLGKKVNFQFITVKMVVTVLLIVIQ